MATYRVFQKKANQKGEAPIYISFYINREKIEVPTKISINPLNFDKSKEAIKASFEFAKDKNLIISDIKSTINDIFVRYRLKKEQLSVELFWSEYRNPGKYKSFFDFCTDYQKLRFQEVTEATRKKHISCLNNLKSFKEVINFEDLTTDFFRRFVLFLRNKLGNKEITINKTIQTISVYVADAVEKGFLKENPIKKVKLRGVEDTTAEAIDESELKTLVDLYNNNVFAGTEQQTLEFFLFLCFSSLHISDAKALSIDQIGDNEFWYMRGKMLNIRPMVVRVPISTPLRKIINHQRGNRKSGILWDNIITDQKINEKLKTIASVAGIKKNLCAKVGRHTFATIFLRGTRDLNALKEIMGHKNIKQTIVYAHVLDQDRKDGVKVFDAFSR